MTGTAIATGHAEFLRRLTAWAHQQPDVAALGLAGSHARGRAGPTSDIDIVILSDCPLALLSTRGWINDLGDVENVAIERYGGLTALRVWYSGGPEAEFGITASSWARLPLDAGTRRVLEDGFRILFDPRNLLRTAVAAMDESG